MTREEYLKRQLEKSGKSIRALSDETGIKYTTLADIFKNVGSSRVENVIKLCSCLGITVNDIQNADSLEENEMDEIKNNLDELDLEMLKKFKRLDVVNKARILGYLDCTLQTFEERSTQVG